MSTRFDGYRIRFIANFAIRALIDTVADSAAWDGDYLDFRVYRDDVREFVNEAAADLERAHMTDEAIGRAYALIRNRLAGAEHFELPAAVVDKILAFDPVTPRIDADGNLTLVF